MYCNAILSIKLKAKEVKSSVIEIISRMICNCKYISIGNKFVFSFFYPKISSELKMKIYLIYQHLKAVFNNILISQLVKFLRIYRLQ